MPYDDNLPTVDELLAATSAPNAANRSPIRSLSLS
jgi:hypothetical protein